MVKCAEGVPQPLEPARPSFIHKQRQKPFTETASVQPSAPCRMKMRTVILLRFKTFLAFPRHQRYSGPDKQTDQLRGKKNRKYARRPDSDKPEEPFKSGHQWYPSLPTLPRNTQ